ncbi:Pentatricopeptide repeat-containing protein [Artemisia annua]|uniref:Pentatricopeptide repeat-containing protein n=1 Tax=Artemisia annua TaxID=35608 RepID=A0A2U1LQ78_ARTAN|nr:Pentatricopeptide repeat-containing protein [Artemisia annua]
MVSTTTGGGEYEHVREERIKENHVRMQKLGIKELSRNLKPVKPKPKVVRPKKPKVVTSPVEPPRRSSRKVGEREVPAEAAGKSKAAKEATEDPNKPKRPGSAFFVFLEEFRETFKKENPTVKAVSAVGKAGGEKWRSLSAAVSFEPSRKGTIRSQAAERKTDYEKLMTAYNKKHDAAEDDEESEKSKSEVDEESGQAAKEASEDPNKPKRPLSAFFIFLEEFREIFKKENPTVKAVSAVGKASGEKWKSMSAAEKAPYEAKAAERKTDYEKLMTAYNKKQDAAEDDEESEKSKSEVHEESGQKLIGTAAVKCALTAAASDIVSVSSESDFRELVSKVLNRGGLDSEAMVTVFEWAVESGKMSGGVESYNVVFKALDEGKGVRGDYETLEIFVDSYVKAKRVSKGVEILKNLDEFGMDEWDLECLKVVLRCLCRRGRVTSADKLLSKTRGKGKVEFDGETYGIVIRGWCKLGRVSEIERVLNEMVEDGFDPDSLSFSYVIEGLGRSGRINDAVKIFENLKETRTCEVNVVVYNAMILNYISIGDIDECLKYYNDMLSNNCEPNMDTYVHIIFAFLKAKRVADAIEMFDEMLGQGVMVTTGVVTSIIDTLCSFGPPHAAMMIYKKAKNAKCTISVTAYKTLLMRLSRFGKCGMLLNLWDEMEQDGYVSDVEVYEHIINGLCNNGQLEKGVSVMEECLEKGFCPSRLISAKLNNKLLAANKVEMAYKLFLKVKKSRRDENARKYWRAKGWHF